MLRTLVSSLPLLRCAFAAFLGCTAVARAESNTCTAVYGMNGGPHVSGEEPGTTGTPAARKVIVIGFVGGFVSAYDLKHPEVQFSACLRDRHPSAVRTGVFTNRQGRQALRWTLDSLDTDGNGVPTDTEKRQAAVIIYGHSWGASETVELARALGQQGIPVLLTVQVDSVHKPGHDDSTIPQNVRRAINFYQTSGLIRGRAEIRAADPERTTILGNIRMAYKGRQVKCGHCSWLARTFSRTHCQIESDGRVWEQISSLVETTLADALVTASASPDVVEPSLAPDRAAAGGNW